MKFDITPSAHIIYCDDIRQEITGKLIYIGVYTGVMFLPSFPITIPQLYVQGNIRIPLSLTAKRGCLSALMGEEELERLEFDMPPGPTEEQIEKLTTQPDSDIVGTMMHNFFLSNLNVEEPTSIRMRVEIDGVRIPSAPLKILQAPQNAFIPQVFTATSSSHEPPPNAPQ
jgi:hypothetical protein